MHVLPLNWSVHRDYGDGHILPEWFVIINHGHDGHCFGIDKRTFDCENGEYEILYWDIDEGLGFESDQKFTDFPSYLEYEILWAAQSHMDNKNRRGRIRNNSRHLIPKIENILEKMWH